MNRFSRHVAVLTAALLFVTSLALAQDEPKNLKVFPADTGKRELIDIMKKWTMALGVRCEYCHVQKVPGDFQSFDFASDEIEHKETARRMLSMVQDLNKGVLPQASGKDGAAVSCVTCHRGLTDPATLDQVILETVREENVSAGTDQYRALHEKYYGTGSYDFAATALMPVVEDLAQAQQDLDGALAVAELAVEYHPEDAFSRIMLAKILMMKGDKEAARQALAKALELDPENRQAQHMQQQLAE